MLITSLLPESPKRVFVLGSGRFGSAAAVKIHARWDSCDIHILDTKSEIPDNLPGIHHTSTDAIKFLKENLRKKDAKDLVIPCVPIHMAFQWILSHLGFCIPVPARLMEYLPGAIAGRDGCIFSSLSDFICPGNCPEPEGYCPETGEKRAEPLFRTMEKISLTSYRTVVARSGQLLPGVGAFTAGQMFELLDTVRKKKGRSLIGTASRCHGVVHGFVH